MKKFKVKEVELPEIIQKLTGSWFQVEPFPDGWMEITVKDDCPIPDRAHEHLSFLNILPEEKEEAREDEEKYVDALRYAIRHIQYGRAAIFNKVKPVLEQAIEAFDLDDNFGDDIDLRHQKEEDAVSACYSALKEIEMLSSENPTGPKWVQETNWELLREQKHTLLDLITQTDEAEALDNWIDSIQDWARDELGINGVFSD